MRSRGFSLIEVIVATALLAAGMGLAFAAVHNATRASAAAEVEAARAERLRAVQGFLRRQLEGALLLPMEVARAGDDPRIFEMEADELRFVASMPGYLSRGGPHVQVFRLVRGAGGQRLEFHHEQLTPEGPVPNERPPEVLLEGLAQARFEVRSLGPDGLPGDWTSDWDTPGQIPQLVRLQARFAEPRARWPLFVVAPRQGQAVAPGVGTSAPGPVPGDSGENPER